MSLCLSVRPSVHLCPCILLVISLLHGKNLMICLAVSTQYVSVTDRQTYKRTDKIATAYTAFRII